MGNYSNPLANKLQQGGGIIPKPSFNPTMIGGLPPTIDTGGEDRGPLGPILNSAAGSIRSGGLETGESVDPRKDRGGITGRVSGLRTGPLGPVMGGNDDRYSQVIDRVHGISNPRNLLPPVPLVPDAGPTDFSPGL